MTQSLKTAFLLGVLALMPASLIAHAQSTTSNPMNDPLMTSGAFLSSHPDLRFRLLGLEAFKKKEYEDALRFFKRASYYADKPSQGMVAELLWNGQGTPRDPVMAYVWMDLAAERGYDSFLPIRERYWETLDDAQKAQAIEAGQAIYAQYGDAAAKPRLAAVLRRERRQSTGSRTGMVGALTIYIPGPNGEERIDGSKFYDPKYWDPQQYQAWQDTVWSRPRTGTVSVGEIQTLPGAKEGSRIPETKPEADVPEPTTPERDEPDLGTRKP